MPTPATTLWSFRRADVGPVLAILLIPVLIALPELVGYYKDNPMLYVVGMGLKLAKGRLPGLPYIDPNDGFTTQALGHLAAEQWLHGTVPWWNPFTGVGMPLGGEYQPAMFFPPTFLLLLPHGVLLRHLALQYISGLGCYAFVRQLGLSPLAAATGGLLFALNGTLAWFADPVPAPLSLLPWVMLGVERAAVRSCLSVRGQTGTGWRLLAVAMALMLLAGFPEVAFISGLLVALYAFWRLIHCPREARLGLLWRVAAGGLAGIALAAPQLIPFAEFLPLSIVGGHSGAFGHVGLPPDSFLPSYLAPYAFGPIFAYTSYWPALNVIWGNVGGYVDLLLLTLAAYGLAWRRDSLGLLLLGWIVLATLKIFAILPISDWWNFVPGVGIVAFYRYAMGSVEFAVILLVCFAIEGLQAQARQRAATLLAVAVCLAGFAWVFTFAHRLWPLIEATRGQRHWMEASLGWLVVFCGLAIYALTAAPARRRAHWIVALAMLDAIAAFAVPTLSNRRQGQVDLPAVAFLQKHLGLQRFYTLGPIPPNYGAYFQIASINHNYMPVPATWTAYIAAHLDPLADPADFIGTHLVSTPPDATSEFLLHLRGFAGIGVKYLVASPGPNPFRQAITLETADKGNIALQLAPGQSVRGVIPQDVFPSGADIGRVGVLIGNFRNTADGSLVVTLCGAGQCISGRADLAQSADDQSFWVALPRDILLPAHAQISYSIAHQGGTRPVAVWEYPVSTSQSLTGPGGPVPGFGLPLKLTLGEGAVPRQVYADDLVNIYPLPAAKPYFEAAGGHCRLQPQSRTEIEANCSTPDTLIRREMFFPGWQARVGGKAAPIVEQDALFQAIPLPSGRSRTVFSYSPPHEIWGWLAAGLALLALLFASVTGGGLRTRFRRDEV